MTRSPGPEGRDLVLAGAGSGARGHSGQPGQGRLPVESGFDGPLCVEHHGGDGLGVAAINRNYIRGILEAKPPGN